MRSEQFEGSLFLCFKEKMQKVEDKRMPVSFY